MGSVSGRRAREREHKPKEREEARGRGKIDGVVDKGSWKREIRWKRGTSNGESVRKQLYGGGESERDGN